MSKRQENLLLEQAYKAISLRDNFENLTIPQLRYVIEHASPAELDVLEEFFSGLRNIGKAAKKGASSAVSALGRSAKDKATAAGQAVRDKATDVKNKAVAAGKQVADTAGRAVDAAKAGAAQVGKNVSDMYKSGEAEAAAQKRQANVSNLLDNLTKELEALKQANPVIGKEIQDFNSLSLGEIIDKVGRGTKSKVRGAGKARERGFTGGVGQAMRSSFA